MLWLILNFQTHAEQNTCCIVELQLPSKVEVQDFELVFLNTKWNYIWDELYSGFIICAFVEICVILTIC